MQENSDIDHKFEYFQTFSLRKANNCPNSQSYRELEYRLKDKGFYIFFVANPVILYWSATTKNLLQSSAIGPKRIYFDNHKTAGTNNTKRRWMVINKESGTEYKRVKHNTLKIIIM